MAQEKVTVAVTDNGKRFDVLVSEHFPELSRTRVQQLIKKNFISVNKQSAKGNYRVKTNDVIEIELPKNQELKIEAQEMNLDIVYQDQDIAIINKPKGLIVHPSASSKEATLVSGLLAQLDDLSGINGTLRPGIVHRLDKDTSGLLIIAKNDKAHQFLAKQLQDKTMQRNYYALVQGVIKHDVGTIDAPIGRDPKDRKKMTVTSKNSKNAVTHFKVIKRFKNYCLLDCQLETGRTHQIRVHLQYIGHPVVGDEKYGFKKTRTADGQMLHAYKLSFLLPNKGQEKTVEIALPKEFELLLAKLTAEEDLGN